MANTIFLMFFSTGIRESNFRAHFDNRGLGEKKKGIRGVRAEGPRTRDSFLKSKSTHSPPPTHTHTQFLIIPGYEIDLRESYESTGNYI